MRLNETEKERQTPVIGDKNLPTEPSHDSVVVERIVPPADNEFLVPVVFYGYTVAQVFVVPPLPSPYPLPLSRFFPKISHRFPLS